MNDILLSIGLTILGLSVLVTIHELGHFLPAKLFGMKVEKFFLFFPIYGAKIYSSFWGKKKEEIEEKTEYGIGVLPLGGFVSIAGIIDESLDTENMGKPAEPWEFRAKPVWQRLIVMVGGVIMNVILGILIFTFVKFNTGESKIPMSSVQAIEVEEGTIADKLGFKSGDKVLSFKGQPIQYFEEIASVNILLHDDVYFDVERNGEKIKITVPNNFINEISSIKRKEPTILSPRLPSRVLVAKDYPAAKAGIQDGDEIIRIDTIQIQKFTDITPALKNYASKTIDVELVRNNEKIIKQVTLNENAQLGVRMDIKLETVKYGLIEAVVPGTKAAFGAVSDNVRGMKKVATGDADASKSFAGPIKIAGIYAQAYNNSGWQGFWMLTGMLSMVLAFMNILPIPALDGGHVVFLLMEAITGKEPSINVRLYAQYIGMAIVGGLMIFILFNDIFNR